MTAYQHAARSAQYRPLRRTGDLACQGAELVLADAAKAAAVLEQVHQYSEENARMFEWFMSRN